MPAVDPSSSSAFSPEVRRSLPWIFAARLLINTATRMVYSFLPALARGTGLGEGAMTWVLFARDMAGLAGPAAAKLARDLGRWRLASLSTVAAGVSLAIAATTGWGFAVGMVLWGICGVGLLVGANSWIAESVAYQRRGRATGIVEFTWAASALIGLPIMGVVIDTWGWRAAPASLAALSIPLGLAMASHGHDSRATKTPGATPQSAGPLGANATRALAAMATLMAAAQGVFYGHGLWLEATYGFSASQVGFAIITVGGAESLASFGVARFSDRVGKRNAALAGTTLFALTYVLLAVAPAPPLALGLTLLVMAFLGFEFAIVASIAMVAELAPNNREKVVGRSVAFTTLARGLGVLVAGFVYTGFGFAALMAWSAVLAGVALVGFWLVDEPAGSENGF